MPWSRSKTFGNHDDDVMLCYVYSTYRAAQQRAGTKDWKLTLTRWIEGLGDWDESYKRAQAFVRQLTLLEKVNLTTGTGWSLDHCVGNVGTIPRLGFDALCMQDSPLGVRFADYVSAFPAGGTIAAAWDRGEWYLRGYQMGQEHRGKGVDVQLGPVVGPIGRNPKGGVS